MKKMEKAKIPFFKKSDLDASIGVFFDGFSKVIVAIAVMEELLESVLPRFSEP